MNGRQFLILLLCTAAVLLAATTADACPGCKDAIAENDDASYHIARGYFWSILFMMSMPFLIAGTFGTYIYIEMRRARRDQEALQETQVESSAVQPADTV